MEDPTVKYPETFDGRFYFTNFSEEDFVGKWNNVDHTFPAKRSSPIIIPDESLENIQSIRKKFATDLAVRELFKSKELKKMERDTPIGQGQSLHVALTYTPDMLQPYIDKCLAPMPEAKVKTTRRGRPPIHLSENTRVLKGDVTKEGSVSGESLVGNGTVVA